jgi:hypothetical protein
MDWQMTAKAIYCEAVDDDVVIMVHWDGNIRCTGYQKYVEHGDKRSGVILEKKSRALSLNLKCEGPSDPRIIGYRDTLLAQDKT